jgi:hypothetical protein
VLSSIAADLLLDKDKMRFRHCARWDHVVEATSNIVERRRDKEAINEYTKHVKDGHHGRSTIVGLEYQRVTNTPIVKL